jgi:hypothetical protein
MFSLRKTLALGVALLCLTAPARAVELDKYLPADTVGYLSINFKQIGNSSFVKALGLDTSGEYFKKHGDEAARKVLDDLGFDPFKDLESLTFAVPGGDDKAAGLMIVKGTFDVAKFKEQGDKAVKDYTDIIKSSRAGDHTIYEVRLAEALKKVDGLDKGDLPDKDATLFMAVADEHTILSSPSKDRLTEALKKAGGKDKPALKNKAFQALLEKQSDKQALSLTALGDDLLKGPFADAPAAVKDFLEKVEAIGVGVALGDDMKLEAVISTKSADDARALAKLLNDRVNQGLTVVGLLAIGQKEWRVAQELLKTVKVKADGKTVTLKSMLDPDDIVRALK